MLDWLCQQVSKILRWKTDEQMARNMDQCLAELALIRQDLNERLIEKSWTVDRIIIERLQADKVELNLDSIDIKDLSGMLGIGFNYGGRQIRTAEKGGAKTAQQGSDGELWKKESARRPAAAGNGGVDTEGNARRNRNAGERSGDAGRSAIPPSGTPSLNIRFK